MTRIAKEGSVRNLARRSPSFREIRAFPGLPFLIRHLPSSHVYLYSLNQNPKKLAQT